jgi:hypothetical protein
MQASTSKTGQRGVCISLRQDGGEIELKFDGVRLDADAGGVPVWRHEKNLGYRILSVPEFHGRLSTEQAARFGMGLLDLLFVLTRPESNEPG